MTKKEIIKAIQKREAELFLKIKIDEQLFGPDSPAISNTRNGWIAVNNLMEDLGIKHDINLPENQKAIEIIQKNKLKKEALI